MGNGFGGYGNGSGMPYIMNNVDSGIQRGFDQQAVISGINGLNASLGAIAQSQCNGFNGVTTAINNGFATAEVANNARQMANLQGMNDIAMGLQQCLKKMLNKVINIFSFTNETVGTCMA